MCVCVEQYGVSGCLGVWVIVCVSVCGCVGVGLSVPMYV
jgi:hypothetical protein